ncbi:MAG: leucine-rich repeat protein, partial [Prevotellaceae bacterium]|nr:leucine-rich repeat protein [Prevotellaceae bacterium]
MFAFNTLFNSQRLNNPHISSKNIETLKRFFVLLLCTCATASIALAQASGPCGDSCSWAITGSSGSYTLTISGSGKMENYSLGGENKPWKSYLSEIKAVAVGSGITSIGSSAFANTPLTSITLPASLKSIGETSFYRCMYLTTIDIPEGVTSIGSRAFEECYALKDVTIPTSVKTIKNAAFRSCTTLTSIVIPERVVSIDEFTFNECSALTSVSMPQSVVSFGNGAFRSCQALKSITIPRKLLTIGHSCFQSCAALTSISLPEGLSFIGMYGFASCSGLTSVTLPKGVLLAQYVFKGCTALTSATLSEGVAFENISGNFSFGIFYDCIRLDTIINFSERPQVIVDRNVFFNISPTATLFVPFHLLSIYRTSPVWQEFSIATYKGLVTASDIGGAKDSSVIYDGSPHGIGAIALRSEFADVCSVEGPFYTGVSGTSYAAAAALPVDAGAYSVSAGIDFTAASGFRDTSVVLGTLTIRKAVPTRAHFSIASSGGLTCSYDGLAHGVTALPADSSYRGLGAVTVKYNGRSTGSPVAAGVYDIAVNITEGTNFSAVTDLWLGTLTISKVKPAEKHLSYPLSTSVTYDGLPHAVSVSINETLYEGMGAITVKYNGNISPPVGAGEYDVSVDIADGLNFGSVSGLSLGKLAICYSVTFESNGGSSVAGQTVLPGEVAAAPANPTKLNNTFAGWCSNEELTTLWSFPSDKVTGNTKLYARWIGSEKATCKVSFN